MARQWMLIRKIRLLPLIFIISFPISVPNARDFMKNLNVRLFARLIVVFLMKCIRKPWTSYWLKRKNCTCNRAYNVEKIPTDSMGTSFLRITFRRQNKAASELLKTGG